MIRLFWPGKPVDSWLLVKSPVTVLHDGLGIYANKSGKPVVYVFFGHFIKLAPRPWTTTITGITFNGNFIGFIQLLFRQDLQ